MSENVYRQPRIPGDAPKPTVTHCSLTIANDSDYDSNGGNFIFHNTGTRESVNVPVPSVPKHSRTTVPFDWPYSAPWNAFAGVINGFGYHWSVPDGPGTFPNQTVTLGD
jgi:hypothetical protein